MYQVIARKYRPQNFQDVVNQEHVKTTLENAIAQGRIAHGYIFSGQRGTGKTTIARILARCLNCIQGPTATPCGECASCREITAGGGAVDVIEIDAASNRGINEMRELRENVRYQPARDRYKVFIVDEAHQITNEAFNALLKTIEEPPPWAVFVLCTTEAHKIPATIASRCQHFSFRSVDFEDLTARMAWICEQEGIAADPEALAVLAQAGEGSVRDSLSALDQAIACCGARLTAPEVRALLGAFALESLEKVTGALAAADSRAMLEVVDDLERNGQNLQHFSRELARFFRNLLVARIAGAGGAGVRLIAASTAQREKLAAIASGFSEEDLTRYLQLTLDLFRDLQSSLQPRFHLEIGLLRLVHAGKLLPIEQALAGLGEAPARPAALPPPSRPTAAPVVPPTASASRPTPFELDRARKAGVSPEPPRLPEPQGSPKPQRPPEAQGSPAPQRSAEPQQSPKPQHPPEAQRSPEPPQSSGANGLAPQPAPMTGAGAAPEIGSKGASDWRSALHAALMELGLPYTADAVENSRVAENLGELQFITGKSYKLALREEDLRKALQHIGARSFRIKVIVGEGAEPAAPLAGAASEDDVSARALGNPEVQRFREVFGGEVRKVRNLKES
jgi:DNA polymerase III subunit gamma/tau